MNAATSDGQCAWNDHGYRCQCMGVWSDSTTGGGPWYCSQHDRERRGIGPREARPKVDQFAGYGLRKETDESSREFAVRCVVYCKTVIAQMNDPERANRDWARRLLDRFADGEELPQPALQMACVALHKDVDDIRALRRAT